MLRKISILLILGFLLSSCGIFRIEIDTGLPGIGLQTGMESAELTPTRISTAIPAMASATPEPTFPPTPFPTAEPAPAAENVPPPVVTDIAAGAKHACALLQDGSVWCWGKNEFGQLGDGSTVDSFGPVQVKGLSGRTVAVTAGWSYTCALSDAGGVQCWGYNKYGELGNGASMNGAQPIGVQGLGEGVRSIAAGDDHTCAVLTDGTLRCWGYNETGQLGDRTVVNSIVPENVIGMAHPITAVTAGWSHTCALSDQHGILCWGDNSYGQLGDGTTLPYRSYPGVVPGLENNVAALSARGGHACALLTTGGVQCWGYNLNGELGDGTLENRSTHGNVKGLSAGVTAVAAGGTHTCAIIRGGGVMCWGRNHHGQLGDGSTTSRLTPVNVSGLTKPVVKLALGNEFTCALTTDGRVSCWGENANGQLGDGTLKDRLLPVSTDIFSVASSRSILPSGITHPIAGGARHTCWITKTGGVQCWGNNHAGQLGNGTFVDSNVPVDVSGLSSGAVALAAGGNHTCALLLNGSVRCWGENYTGESANGGFSDWSVPVAVGGLEQGGAKAIAAGTSHTCVILDDGGVACWGANDNGQLALPLGTTSWLPHRVDGIPGEVRAISSRLDHTCAETENGGVYCWGLNDHGQLGNGTTDPQAGPVLAMGLERDIVVIAAGGAHSCAGWIGVGVTCWGQGGEGQLGYPTFADQHAPVPALIDSGLGVPAGLTAGLNHTCLLTSSGAVYCWGAGGDGELGNGETWNRNSPVAVKGLERGVLFVQAGDRHTCAILTGWIIRCWGNNWAGQLGNGDRTNSNVPVDVQAARILPNGITSPIGAGGSHSCWINNNGGVQCWGKNQSGQLGNGRNLDSTLPVDVVGLSSGVTALAAAGDHTCALLAGGGVRCWGANYSGELGDGTYTDRNAPVAVVGLEESGAKAIAAGGGHSCAILTDGGVVCWGANNNRQLAMPLGTTSPVPHRVDGIPGKVRAISSISDHTCAVTEAGSAFCWGLNDQGQLGDGTNDPQTGPVMMQVLETNILPYVEGGSHALTAVAAGGSHTCAIVEGGDVVCWGRGKEGQLSEVSMENHTMPGPVIKGLDLFKAEAVTAGFYHTCALVPGGAVYCWGSGGSGELGYGNTWNSYGPVLVKGLDSGVLFVQAGDQHTCAILAGWTIQCWGNNLSGQLGNGGNTNSDIPVDVQTTE